MKSKDIEYASGKLKSLNALRKEHREAPCEGHPKSEPQFLMPYLIGDLSNKDGKQIVTTDTQHEPDCLRFCPSNSSDNVEISLSGKYLSITIIVHSTAFKSSPKYVS